MKVRISIIITYLAVTWTFAQTTPSPSGTDVINNANNPITLFTGTVANSVPLFTVETKNGATVPIGLVYNSSGIKVDEVAGPVGLGWQLLAGGTITRLTRGLADETKAMVGNPLNPDFAMLKSILDENVDPEKDLFFFNIPGASGKFIFEGDLYLYAQTVVWCPPDPVVNPDYTTCFNACAGDPTCEFICESYNKTRLQCEGVIEWDAFKTLPYSDLKFTYFYDGTDGLYWKITDPQGVEYTFESTEVTKANVTEGPLYDPQNEKDFISTWYLTSISYPNATAADEITFSYTSPIDIVTERKEYKTLATGPLGGGTLTVDNTEVVKYRTDIGTRYLSKITFPKGSVDFTYDTRNDLTSGQRLTAVILKDKQDNEISRYTLNHSYFSSANSFYMGSTHGPCVTEECQRLKLESVFQDGSMVQSFVYRNEEDYTGPGLNYYELPPRDSYYFDHWGYWNAGGNLGNNYVRYPQLINATLQDYTGQFNLLSGMDRNPNDYAQANMLTQVHYPTGGHTQYKYEVIYGGNVRVKDVKTFDESNTLVAGSSYTYFDQIITPTPVYHMWYAGEVQVAIYQRSRSNVLDLNGPPVGYGRVVVTDLMGQGRQEHFFQADPQISLANPTKGYYTLDFTDESLTFHGAITDPNRPPFSTRSLLFYDRGNPTKVESYDSVGTLISQRTITYDNIHGAAEYLVDNLAMEVKRVDGNDVEVFTSRHVIASKTYRPQIIVDTFYDTGGSISTTTSHVYHPTYKTFPMTIESVQSDGYESKSITSYPMDISSSTLHDVTVLNSMVANNVLGIPVQQETQIKYPGFASFLTNSVSITTFKEELGMFLPHKNYSLPLSAPVLTWSESDLLLTNEVLSHTSDGQVQQQRGLDGVVQEFVYDSEGYLTQRIVNPGPNQRVTEYTYQPLVGLQQVKDPNNRTVSYEYDYRNRLLLTRNNEGNITTRYRYQSETDPSVPVASISASFHANGNFEDLAHSFSLVDLICPYGECSYSWDWGDGTTSGNVTADTHTYVDGGYYTITVTISSQELEDGIITKDILIQNDVTPTWTVSAISGPTQLDLNNPVGVYTVSITEGVHTCSSVSYSFQWQSRLNGQTTWLTHTDTDEMATIDLSEVQEVLENESYDIQVVVSDACGTMFTVPFIMVDIDDGSQN